MSGSLQSTAPVFGRLWLGRVVIAAAIVAAFAGTVSAPFVFDDIAAIERNPTIRTLWPPWGALMPPPDTTGPVGRPVVNLSLAINFAIGGTDVRGYHVFNVLVHLAASLTLLGVLRRTLAASVLPEWIRRAANPLSFVTTLLWALHPLQTESVTCIVQRTETLGSLFFLTTLYCFIRGIEGHAVAARRWLTLCVASCLLGMATKEIVVSAPLLCLLYARTFVAGTFAAAWRQHRGWYVALAGTWLLLALLIVSAHERGGSIGFVDGINAWTSLLTQSRWVVVYLKLAAWPTPLVLDYGVFSAASFAAAWPAAALLTALAGATIYAIVRRPSLGFAGAWFFLILAPSSSVVPLLSQVAAEHRMYLPLAAVVVLVVLAVHRGAGRAAPAVFAVLALALGIATVSRNADYRSALALWQDTVDQRPQNPRARFNLALELSKVGDKAGAMREYEAALRISPRYIEAHLNLATLLLEAGRNDEARAHDEMAYRLDPTSAVTNNTLGLRRASAGDVAGAIPFFERAVQAAPTGVEALNNLGYALAASGRFSAAIDCFGRSLAARPDFAATHQHLGQALLLDGQSNDGLQELTEAVRLDPASNEAHVALGNALASLGRYDEALPHLQAAVAVNSGDLGARYALGTILARLNRRDEAIQSLREALRIDPGNEVVRAALYALGAEPEAPKTPAP